MKCNIDRVLEMVANLRVMSVGQAKSPHKYIFLLTLARLYEKDPDRKNLFPLDDEFESTFLNVCREFYSDSAPEGILVEFPFYHLTKDRIWALTLRKGKEQIFQNYEQSVNRRLTRNRLIETIEYGYLVDDIDQCLRDEVGRSAIINKIRHILRDIVDPHVKKTLLTIRESSAETSLFAHESSAIDNIRSRITANNLGTVLSNLELYDDQSNRYFETDLVVIAEYGIYIVELKHWSGRIEVKPNSWVQNGSFFKRDPHIANNFKAKLLKGMYEHHFPQFPHIYFQSVITFTNPDAVVEGGAVAATAIHNPTFATVERFIEYLRNERKIKNAALKQSQVASFVDYLSKLQNTARPKDFVFPGYEIVEHLYQSVERAEVIARRTDVRFKHLSRLRIFFTIGPSGVSQVLHERATATLNAVAKVGDHPNILKVWSVPNEDNFIVEGSDWSETGTLRDLLQVEGTISIDRAKDIIGGILNGLNALHKECVVHRALSPENILMSGNTPKLMNFDLSFQLEDNRTTVIPDVSKLVRSAYMAPEIYKGDITPEANADLFSVGVILYTMLVGEHPFGCSTDLERTNGQLSTIQLNKLEKVKVPQELQKLIADLIRLNPAQRPATAEAVMGRLIIKPAAPSPNRQLQANERIGNIYEIESFVKKSVQSQIYKAVGIQGKQVAIKLFDIDVPRHRIVEEKENAGRVRSSGIVEVDGYNQAQDGRFFIAFGWVSSKSLRNEIDNGKRPDASRFRRIALQLLDALKALHEFSDHEGAHLILHNDIKPDNILFTDTDRAVLIDFGSASDAHIGTYEGTEGYVAPDLRLGQDRKYCVDGDLYALGVTLLEWLTGSRTVPDIAEVLPQGFPEPFLQWIVQATARTADERFLSVEVMLNVLQETFIPKLPSVVPIQEHPVETSVAAKTWEIPETRVVPARLHFFGDVLCPNPFAAYLNSLHCRTAASENALAESQAINEFFGLIHVAHPLTDMIRERLLGDAKEHVILTGHAGDGKSTIAIELLKKLKGLPLDKPLSGALEPRTDIDVHNGMRLSLIKDFSELTKDGQQSLLKELMQTKGRFLLVSNTGTLLDTFKYYEQASGGNPIVIENRLLKAFSSVIPQRWDYGGSAFTIINLSMMDNLNVAEKVFHRMVAPACWQACESSECRHHCPIYHNVKLIQKNADVAISRVCLAYLRMYEYGTRLTLRQLCAHLAYMITSGLTYPDIVKLSQKPSPPMMSEFMFFNRFFGDNGRMDDTSASQLRAIRAVQDQHFGVRNSPTWERRLWTEGSPNAMKLNAQGCEKDFEALRRFGSGLSTSEEYSSSHAIARARDQARRMLFFLHAFENEDNGFFLRSFLNSTMILNFTMWQKDKAATLTLEELTKLPRSIFHVLQEQFTGVRLPEGAPLDSHLFITLTRRGGDIRQSAQVVLARIPQEAIKLNLVSRDNGMGGSRRELILKGQQGLDVELTMTLPFLDYVMMRNEGAIGEDLQRSYVDRLERFKARLLTQTSAKSDENIMLVRLRTNHTFRRQVFGLRRNRLEVIDG